MTGWLPVLSPSQAATVGIVARFSSWAGFAGLSAHSYQWVMTAGIPSLPPSRPTTAGTQTRQSSWAASTGMLTGSRPWAVLPGTLAHDAPCPPQGGPPSPWWEATDPSYPHHTAWPTLAGNSPRCAPKALPAGTPPNRDWNAPKHHGYPSWRERNHQQRWAPPPICCMPCLIQLANCLPGMSIYGSLQ